MFETIVGWRDLTFRRRRTITPGFLDELDIEIREYYLEQRAALLNPQPPPLLRNTDARTSRGRR